MRSGSKLSSSLSLSSASTSLAVPCLVRASSVDVPTW